MSPFETTIPNDPKPLPPGVDSEKAQIQQLEKGDVEPPMEGGGRRIKSEAEKTLVRKLDWCILPILWIMYWFNYLDRNAITVARLDDLEEELNLTSTEYQTCVSILFVGYILGQIPASKSYINL